MGLICQNRNVIHDNIAGHIIMPVDMLGQMLHVETVVCLSKRKPDSYVRLSLDMEDYYRIKDQEKAEGEKGAESGKTDLEKAKTKEQKL